MKPVKPEETTCPKSRAEWRDWLLTHHAERDSVWVVYHKKDSGVSRVSWKDAVEEALCFGWIDGRAQPIDDRTYRQYFCKRKPGGMWSKINKESVSRLTVQGLMTDAGLAVVERSKRDGSWTLMDDVEELVIPADLQAALKAIPGALEKFNAWSRSDRRIVLMGLVLAKRPETRRKRIGEALARLSRDPAS